MPNNNPKQSFREKLKNANVNRATIITAVLLVVAVITIVAVTVSTNRTKKDEILPPTTNPPAATTPAPTPTTPPTSAPQQTPPPTNDSPVEEKLPSFALPVSGVLSKSHDATLQVYSNTMKDYRVHLGVDLVTEQNAPVYAAADGTVSRVWGDVLMGNCIAIKHSGNCYTIYKNLGDTLPEGIAEGVSVKSGQLIGSVGESAMLEIAEEPHLHFEMTVADLAVDPLEYFDEKALESLKYDGSHGE